MYIRRIYKKPDYANIMLSNSLATLRLNLKIFEFKNGVSYQKCVSAVHVQVLKTVSSF